MLAVDLALVHERKDYSIIAHHLPTTISATS